jgi:hypothetical protein
MSLFSTEVMMKWIVAVLAVTLAGSASAAEPTFIASKESPGSVLVVDCSAPQLTFAFEDFVPEFHGDFLSAGYKLNGGPLLDMLLDKRGSFYVLDGAPHADTKGLGKKLNADLAATATKNGATVQSVWAGSTLVLSVVQFPTEDLARRTFVVPAGICK